MDSQKRIPIKRAIELAKIISEQYNIKSYKDWKNFIKRDSDSTDVPGPGKTFLSFKAAKKFVKSLNLKSMQEWRVYCDENHIVNVPSHPAKQYKNEWISWSDFLKGDHEVPSKFLPFKEARKIVRSLHLESCKEWDEYCKSGKKPKNIPHSPQHIYKENGWLGWDCFFGTGVYKDMDDEEILFDIKSELCYVGETMEALRGDMTDEEILIAYEQQAVEVIEAIKEYMKKYPR